LMQLAISFRGIQESAEIAGNPGSSDASGTSVQVFQ
jgi:hypothetical protein